MSEPPVATQDEHSDVRRTSAYYDRTATEYDRQVEGLAANRAIRDAFRSRVSELAGASGTILDFGCGTGTDAAWYEARGHRVVAYDISSGMVNVLRSVNVDAVARERILPVAGNLDDLEQTLRTLPPVDAIAANFAVLNHVHDLEPLFHTLSTHLRSGASLVASLLNPVHRSDMRQRWWWRGALQSLRSGAIEYRGDVTTYRHYLRTIRRASRPHLELSEVGRTDADGRWSSERMGWREVVRQQFVFVVLRKTT
jgi:SAM-dependent methyltransferase